MFNLISCSPFPLSCSLCWPLSCVSTTLFGISLDISALSTFSFTNIFLELTDSVEVLLFIGGIEVSDLEIGVEVFSLGLQKALVVFKLVLEFASQFIQLIEALAAVGVAQITWSGAILARILRLTRAGVV